MKRLLFTACAFFITIILICSYSGQNSFASAPYPGQKEDSVSISNAHKFFANIYRKYPNDYYRIDDSLAPVWSEYSDAKGNYGFRTSFMMIDSSKKDERAYLVEETDSVLNRLFPGLHFYSGRYFAHYELSLNGLSFTGFLYGDSSDFIYGKTSRLHPVFRNALAKSIIPGKTDKEKAGISILAAIRYGLARNANDYRKESITARWKDDSSLEIVGAWRRKIPDTDGYHPNVEAHIMTVYFKDDRISEILIEQ